MERLVSIFLTIIGMVGIIYLINNYPELAFFIIAMLLYDYLKTNK